MRHRRIVISATLLLLLAVAAVFAVGALVPGGTTSAKAGGQVVLTVKHNGTVIKQYTLDQLQAFTVYNGYAGIHDSVGTITGPDPVTGVRVSDVLQDALGGAGITTLQSVDITAPDRFGISPSGSAVLNASASNWVMFDASTGKQVSTVTGQLACILAWARGATPLASDEGPVRLYVADDTQASNVVMRGSDSVQRVSTLNVRDYVLPPWTLKLVGLKSRGARPTDAIDMQSYQTCAAPGCHGAPWTSSGQRWTGVPLYMLLGQVDGGKDMTYNASLARKGYRIRFYSSTGKSVTLSSKITVRRGSIVVANSRNGAALAAKYYPLRLVGPARYVPAAKRLGRITKIVMLPLK